MRLRREPQVTVEAAGLRVLSESTAGAAGCRRHFPVGGASSRSLPAAAGWLRNLFFGTCAIFFFVRRRANPRPSLSLGELALGWTDEESHCTIWRKGKSWNHILTLRKNMPDDLMMMMLNKTWVDVGCLLRNHQIPGSGPQGVACVDACETLPYGRQEMAA